MARIQQTGNTTKLWLSAADTQAWANRPGAGWPCSVAAGHSLFAEFDEGDLVDVKLAGRADEDLPGDEFNALTSDFLRALSGPDHPAIRS